MQIKNIKIFDSTNAADGSWIDISNCVALSVGLSGVESKTWIEVSNDPNIMIDGTSVVSPPATPVLSQAPAPNGGGLTSQGTYFVKLTYITKYGQTLPSSEASLAVSDGNVLSIAAPGPDPAGLAIGYLIYASKTTGTERLQNGPQFVNSITVDSTPGYHYTSNTALPVNQPAALPYLFSTSGPTVPVSNTSGGPGIGINITGDLGTFTPPSGLDEIAIFYDNVNKLAMVNPSCLCWKFLRVRKDNTAQTLETIAWLMGQNG